MERSVTFFPSTLNGFLTLYMVLVSSNLFNSDTNYTHTYLADYFRRWHRQKSNSGGLLVHKSGHHFDLVNWWLDSQPQTVAAMGKLAFYGAENGRRHGWARDYERARGSAEAQGDPFAIDLEGDEALKGIYANAEKEDGYHRDQNVSQKRAVGSTIANLIL